MDKYPKAVSKQCTKIIYEQMNNSIYQIYYDNKNFSIGFFSYIMVRNKNILVLITDKKIINEIKNNKIYVFNEEEKKEIELGDIIFKTTKNDFAIIEIKENMIDKINILDLDNNLNEKDNELY